MEAGIGSTIVVSYAWNNELEIHDDSVFCFGLVLRDRLPVMGEHA